MMMPDSGLQDYSTDDWSDYFDHSFAFDNICLSCVLFYSNKNK